jgi:hypothetical protein
MEIGGIVEKLTDLLDREVVLRWTLLKGLVVEESPQSSLMFGVVLEFLLVRTHPYVLGVAKADRTVPGRLNL